ncbi:molecular chaperone [Yersinia pestis]|uniref:Pili assembly chaperone n=35 Tax=Yersinia pseudotuberculosis complex TaxID=1649845 RepID=A0A3G5L339_YERPE|nr:MULTISPECIES: molecular chaperone [Yersinia pseudotuberculosis complex]ERP74360.1 pilus assembly protein [Yersinia pestis 24H]CQD53210.1 pili assembly chaperone [Yersinia intermedia]AAC69580.1 unknown [Yersinia pestis]AAM85950.1 putative pilin chaperone [Yersinia pestis KIM10+]AAS61891.1 putative pili assembly chaperone [Yersinia pestis biovar Microtus str. 91001]
MRLLSLFLLLFTISYDALAGLIAGSTRIIYQPELRERTLMLANTNDYPVVVQTWIDNGDVDSTPDQAKAPFMVLPAVFKMQAGSVQALRIINKGENLPSDRESVYWLNLYEIPPRERSNIDVHAQVAMAMNTQMKIFYRPNGLAPPPIDAMGKIKFSLKNIDNQYVIIANNPTPYFVSFGQIQLQSQQKNYLIAQSMDMMTGPFSTRPYYFEQPPTSLKGKFTVSYIYFDDAGNQVKNSQSVTVTL